MLVDRKNILQQRFHLLERFPKFVPFFCFIFCFVVLVILDIQAQDVLAFLISLLLLLLNAVECIIGILAEEVKASDETKDSSLDLNMHDVLKDMTCIMSSILHDFRVLHSSTLLKDKLGF